ARPLPPRPAAGGPGRRRAQLGVGVAGRARAPDAQPRVRGTHRQAPGRLRTPHHPALAAGRGGAAMTGVAQAPARQRVIEEEEMIEIEREPRERAETGRVIAHVRAEIPPEHQAQTLRDLARTADGEPQLDATMLEEAAAALADARAPIELVRRDTGELAALACGRCGTVQGLSDPKRARWLVGQCCAPRFCGSC